MARPSVMIPDELLERFDEKIFEMKVEGDLDRSVNRSEMIRRLAREWVDERTDVPDQPQK